LDGGETLPDAIATKVDGATRYQSTETADANGFFVGAATLTATASYQVQFTVTPQFSGTVYTLQIDTSRIGAFVVRDETSASASNSLTAVTGTLNGPTVGTLGLPSLAGLNTSNTTTSPFNQSNTFTLPGLTGVQNFTLTFTWQGSVNS